MEQSGRKRSAKLTAVFLLALAMALTAGTGAAAYADTAYGSYLPTSTDTADTLPDKAVKFNDIDWYIIEDDSTAADAGTVTLLAKQFLYVLCFDDNNRSYYDSSVNEFLYWLTRGNGSFAGVADAIVDVVLRDVGNIRAKLWLLSRDEADKLPIEVKKCVRDWWLRTYYSDTAEFISKNGQSNICSKHLFFGVRPALKLDLSSVVFESESKTFSLKPPHTHSFTYTADGGTITATCSAADCTLPELGGRHTAALTIAAPLHRTYDDGKEAAAVITDANGIQGEATVRYRKKTGGSYGDATETAPTDAGDYKAGITLGEAAASVEYTIAKADSTANAPTGLTAVYGQTLADVTLTNPTGNTPGTWAWADSTQSVGGVVSPAASFKANFTPTDTANYHTVENVDVAVTVDKAAPELYGTLTATATYGDMMADVKAWLDNQKPRGADGAELNGSWTWVDTNIGNSSAGNAGVNIYQAEFTPTDTANYHSVTKDVMVVVEPKHLNRLLDGSAAEYGTDPAEGVVVRLDKDSFIYNDTSQMPTVTVTDTDATIAPNDYSIRWERKTGDSTWTDAYETIYAGTYRALVDGRGNYTGTVTKEYTIEPASPTADEISLGEDPAYNGNPQEPEVMFGDRILIEGVDYVAAYYAKNEDGTYTELQGVPKESRVYRMKLIFKGNYAGAAVKEFAILKADAAVALAPKAGALTCNGSAQALVTAGEASGGEMRYALGTASEATEPYTASIPTAADAGTYYVWYMVKGDENHLDTAAQKLEVTIDLPAFGTPDFTLPAAIRTVEAGAFEGAAMKIVSVPEGCEAIGAKAFKDCAKLWQIRVPANCAIGEGAFSGCGTVYIFAPAGSPAESFCADPANANCVFCEEA